MELKEIFYTALATIAVMAILQLATFLITRMMYPPEPKVVYREVHVPAPQPQVPVQQLMTQHLTPSVQAPPQQQNGQAFIQQQQEIQLPEYEPRKPASDSLRVDPELPPGLQETRPPGT
jgi:hypothetical protein